MRWYHVFFVGISLAAGCVFMFKLAAFWKSDRKEELTGFAFDPILVYAFVAAGFMTLLAWAYLTGQFRDIESPKYEMFERLAEQERHEVAMRKEAQSHE